MSKTLSTISANVVLDLDFRKNTLLDQSGNSNDASVIAGTPSYANTPFGRGITFEGTDRMIVSDSAELQFTSGYILAFGTFKSSTATQDLLSKRDGGGANYSLEFGSSSRLFFYDGAITRTLTVNMEGANMVAVKFVASGTPVGYVNGTNVGDFSGSSTITVNDADISIGNIFTGTVPLFGWNITKLVLVNDSTVLTDAQVADIYDEYIKERGALQEPRRNFQFPTTLEPESSCVIHLDGFTKTGDGKMADLSGTGNHATILAATEAPGVFSKGFNLRGDINSYISIPSGYTNYLSGATAYGISFWIKRADGTANEVPLSRSADNSWYLIRNTGGLTTSVVQSGTKAWVDVVDTDVWVHYYLEHDGTGDTTQLYKDGVALTISSGSSDDPQVSASKDLLIGRIGGGSALSPEAAFADFRLWTDAGGQTRVDRLYSEGAKVLNFRQSMDDVPPTLADVTGANEKIGLTEFKNFNGTFMVTEDSNGRKWIESNTTGGREFYIPSTQAYGTWIWKFNAANQIFAMFTSDIVEDFDAAGSATGYYWKAASDGSLRLQKRTSGTDVSLAKTAASYFTLGVDYDMAFTRNYAGIFTTYIKGGSEFSTWTLVDVTGGSGSNPVTDNTITTSKFSVMFAQNAGEKMSDWRYHEGVLTLAQLNSLYP